MRSISPVLVFLTNTFRTQPKQHPLRFQTTDSKYSLIFFVERSLVLFYKADCFVVVPPSRNDEIITFNFPFSTFHFPFSIPPSQIQPTHLIVLQQQVVRLSIIIKKLFPSTQRFPYTSPFAFTIGQFKSNFIHFLF